MEKISSQEWHFQYASGWLNSSILSILFYILVALSLHFFLIFILFSVVQHRLGNRKVVAC